MKRTRTGASRKTAKRTRIFWYMTAGVGGIVVLIAGLTTHPMPIAEWFHSPSRNVEVQAANDAENRFGTIEIQRGNEQCALLKFDNDTGRTIETNNCRDIIVLDANGVPVPIGTAHRLDSISKSFSDNRR